LKIVEGPIDSLFLSNCLASGDANLSLTSKNISAGKKVLIFDNEPRNKDICKQLNKYITAGYRVCMMPETVEQKDINEMVMSGKTIEEVVNLINTNSYNGLEAQMHFATWKKC
jgi:hypothetical protein